MTARQDIAFQTLRAAQVADPQARPPSSHVALVPGAEAPLLALDLPAGLRGPAREDVARRQLRDRIGAGDGAIEMRPFFAPGAAEAWRRALVADSARLAEWRAQAGPGCRAVLPDYLSLPAAEGLWSVRIEHGSVQARLGLEDGFTAEAPLAQMMLARALEDAEGARPKAVLLQGADDALAALFAAQGIAVHATSEEAAGQGIQPQVLAHGELRFDLRADPRAARDRLRARVLPWRWPLLAGLLAATLWGASQIVATRALGQAAAAERAETLALVREAFVPTGPVLDLRAQVSRAMAARQDAARDWRGRISALTLFGQVARVVAGSEAVSEEFAFDRDALTAILRLADFAAAEDLVAALRAADLRVEVVDLRVSDGESGVRAELRLEAGA